MAKTIGQLTELAAMPAGADVLHISESNVSKKISVTNLTSAALGIVGNKTVGDGTNLVLGTTTGTKVGTSATQKLGFYGLTPVVQPAVTADLLDSLQALGLVKAEAGNTPLNLTAGALSCGTITVADASNIVAGTTTGTKVGTGGTQKIGFWNATPVVQPTAVASLTVSATAGSLPTPDGSVTIANAASPTVVALLEFCVELNAKVDALLTRLRAAGLIAT